MTRSHHRFAAEAKAHEARTPFQVDRDRILYSSAFARLAEITQVTSPEKGYVFHNRLTHSLKVGQLARRIAERLLHDQQKQVNACRGLDPDAAEAAGLAHDMGHPPFGHIAEEELDALVRAEGVSDGYEGNAQSFRIVTRLACGDAVDDLYQPLPGLNLTKRVLDGILKYPWEHGGAGEKSREKWGCYRTERKIFKAVRNGRAKNQKSLTAEIMDWADDITFAIHDLVDFYSAGRIPIDRCKGEESEERNRLLEGMFRRNPDWIANRPLYELALESLLKLFQIGPQRGFRDSFEDRSKLYTFSTILMRKYVNAIKVTPDRERLVHIRPEVEREVAVLKQFTWEYVIESPDLAIPQQGQRAAVRTVFQRLLAAAREGRPELFPPSFHASCRSSENDEERVRLAADCVAGMTEKELMRFYRSMLGMAENHG